MYQVIHVFLVFQEGALIFEGIFSGPTSSSNNSVSPVANYARPAPLDTIIFLRDRYHHPHVFLCTHFGINFVNNPPIFQAWVRIT
jgi:hypothetical protein